MTHEIFGDRYAQGYGKTPPVHNITGLVRVEDGMTPQEALVAAGADFSIEKDRLGRMHNGTFIPTPGEYALVRRHGDDDIGEVLGTVGERYEAIGPRQVVEAFSALDFKLTHLGMYQRDFLMVYDVGRFDLAGDLVINSLVIRAPQGGNGSVSAMFTPCRMRCANQLVVAARMATFNIGISHVGNVDQKLYLARYIVGRVEAAQRETTEAFQAMMNRVLIEDEIDRIIEAAWPDPPLPDDVSIFNEIRAGNPDETEDEFLQLKERHDRALERYEAVKVRLNRFRDGARQMLELANQEFVDEGRPDLQNTAWAVWAGGVAATSTWRNGSSDSVDYSTLFSTRAKEVQSAFDVAMDIIKNN